MDPKDFLDRIVEEFTAAAAGRGPNDPVWRRVQAEPGMDQPTAPSLFLPPPNLKPLPGKAPIDYMGVYMVLSDYFAADGSGFTAQQLAEGVVRVFSGLASKRRLFELLVIVNRGFTIPAVREGVLAEHRQHLSPAALTRYDNAVGVLGRVPIAPQPVLASIAHVLTMEDAPVESPPCPPEAMIVPFVHAISEDLASPEAEGAEDTLGGMPVPLAMEIVCNAAFNEAGDMYAEIGRFHRLWRDHGSAGSRYLDGRTAAELAREATGLEVEDILALGFAVMCNALAWEPGRPLYLNEDFNSDMNPATIRTFIALISTTPEAMSQALQNRRSRWDFLELQRHPVLQTDQGLMVLDATLLFERVTAGLYWDVHDYLARTAGGTARHKWTQAWGATIESMVEASLSSHQPWNPGGKLVWDEDDLAAAYGKEAKRCDLVVDLGGCLLVADVVSGQLTVATRIDGDPDAFQADLHKLVFKKVQQVHDTCMNLLRDESALTGVTPSPPRRLFPVVAIGSDFARHPIVTQAIEDYRVQAGLLGDARIAPLSVIDISEIEMLEGVREQGDSISAVLSGWHASGIASMSLRNYLIEKVPATPETFRSARVRKQVDASFQDLLMRLRLRDQPPPEE